MIASITITLALGGAAQATVACAPLATVDRLVATANARHGETPVAAATIPAQRARLGGLREYVSRFHRRMLAGGLIESDVYNLQQVTRDLVEEGVGLAVLPEERLCWQRAGLNLAHAQYYFVRAGAAAGTFPPQHLNQARARIESFRAGYDRALAECAAAAR
ncbi:hypothetical protein J0H58_30735 [bacterium]|nr:hypothetical protein [bacterium]